MNVIILVVTFIKLFTSKLYFVNKLFASEFKSHRLSFTNVHDV